MKLITSIALMSASAMAENCLPTTPPTSIAGALSDFSNSTTQCITSAANVLSASASNIINLQADKIADLEENYASCQEEKENAIGKLYALIQDNEQVIADLQQTVENSLPMVQLTLSNPKFADNKYYNSGAHNLAPSAAIDGSWINHAWNNGFAHSKSARNPKFLVDLRVDGLLYREG